MGPVGFPEMFVIFIVALLLFGPKKLPELGRMLGKGLSEFRRAKNELKSTFETHMQELEREARMSEAKSSPSLPSAHSSSYSYPYEEYNPYNAESPGYIAPSASSVELEPARAAEEKQVLAPAEVVSGTVARSNGVRPLSEHPDPAPDQHDG